MDLNWMQSFWYGLFAGLSEILPISARAHKILLLRIFGAGHDGGLPPLLIHSAILAALYRSSLPQIIRISRAVKLSHIPKKKRKRPLDTKSLMDYRLLRTMLFPMTLCYLAYNKLSFWENKLVFISVFLFVNGIIIYVPQFLPGCNKDSRTLSRVDGLLMGLGGGLSVFPGISGIGAAVSVGSVCGVDRSYALNMSFMLSMGITVCLIVFDILGIIAGGIGTISVLILLKYVMSAAAAYAGAAFGIRLMRLMAVNSGIYIFSYYCWGLALFTFILNLLA